LGLTKSRPHNGHTVWATTDFQVLISSRNSLPWHYDHTESMIMLYAVNCLYMHHPKDID